MATGNAIQGAAGTGAAGAAGGGLSGTYPNPVVVLDSTASDIQPDGAQAAGAAGLPADAGHIHRERAWLPLLLTGSSALAETYPRMLATASLQLAANTTGYFTSIPLYKGMSVAHITMTVAATVEAGGSHGWYALCDSSANVLAVSADQTGATVWGAANTDTAVAVTIDGSNPYVVASSGFYYVAVCVTATTRPAFLVNSIQTGQNNSAPHQLSGIATVTSTPPAVGAALGALTTANSMFYTYVS